MKNNPDSFIYQIHESKDFREKLWVTVKAIGRLATRRAANTTISGEVSLIMTSPVGLIPAHIRTGIGLENEADALANASMEQARALSGVAIDGAKDLINTIDKPLPDGFEAALERFLRLEDNTTESNKAA